MMQKSAVIVLPAFVFAAVLTAGLFDRTVRAQETSQDRRRRRVFGSAGDARGGVVRHRVQRLSSSGPRRRQRPGASRRALRANFRGQRSEDALHENSHDDAARRGGESGRCRVPRHRRARTQGERISCGDGRVDGRGAFRHPGAARQSEAAATCRRFLLRRSGGMSHARTGEHLAADQCERAGEPCGHEPDAKIETPTIGLSARRYSGCSTRWRTVPRRTRATRCTSEAC